MNKLGWCQVHDCWITRTVIKKKQGRCISCHNNSEPYIYPDKVNAQISEGKQ